MFSEFYKLKKVDQSGELIGRFRDRNRRVRVNCTNKKYWVEGEARTYDFY